MVSAKLRMLHKTLLVHQIQEFLLGHKVVLHGVLFATTRSSGGVRDAEAELIGVVVKQPLEDGRLAGAAGSGDDNGRVGVQRCGIGAGRVGGCHGGGMSGKGAEERGGWAVYAIWASDST